MGQKHSRVIGVPNEINATTSIWNALTPNCPCLRFIGSHLPSVKANYIRRCLPAPQVVSERADTFPRTLCGVVEMDDHIRLRVSIALAAETE